MFFTSKNFMCFDFTRGKELLLQEMVGEWGRQVGGGLAPPAAPFPYGPVIKVIFSKFIFKININFPNSFSQTLAVIF